MFRAWEGTRRNEERQMKIKFTNYCDAKISQGEDRTADVEAFIGGEWIHVGELQIDAGRSYSGTSSADDRYKARRLSIHVTRPGFNADDGADFEYSVRLWRNVSTHWAYIDVKQYHTAAEGKKILKARISDWLEGGE